MKTSTLLLSCCAAVALWSDPADACGCFAPPNPTVPVVQAGERILFAVKNGEVTAHVQVQYSGASGADFGWLLPLPGVGATFGFGRAILRKSARCRKRA